MSNNIDKQIECVRREITMRKSVYPRLVASGKKTSGSAEQEINCMTDVLNTLLLAERAHLDKSWNQPKAVSDWLSYPLHQPTTEQIYNDFLVVYLNPHYINKSGFVNRVPKYKLSIMTWLGDCFENYDHYKITYFKTIPDLPKE